MLFNTDVLDAAMATAVTINGRGLNPGDLLRIVWQTLPTCLPIPVVDSQVICKKSPFGFML